MSREAVAVIPARGGSVGIPRKNLVPLGGKPLIAHTILAAQTSRLVTRVIVSTEDSEIKNVAKDWGAEVPFLRPQALAAGTVHASQVVIHVLQQLQMQEHYYPDVVIMLLPTSPLRQPEQIDSAIELFHNASAPSVVSVVELDKQLPHLRKIDSDGMLYPLLELGALDVQRQDLEPLFALNGSIYVAAPKTFLLTGTFHMPGAIGFLMPFCNSVDINSQEDITLAEYYLKRGE